MQSIPRHVVNSTEETYEKLQGKDHLDLYTHRAFEVTAFHTRIETILHHLRIMASVRDEA